MIERVVAAVAKRQKVLDFAIANPHCAAADVAAHMGIDTEAAKRLMADMSDLGELQRHGSHMRRTWTACKATTKSVDEIMAATRTKKQAAWKARAPKNEGRKEGGKRTGVTTNDPSKHKPHANQGGQVAQSGGIRSSQMSTCKVSL